MLVQCRGLRANQQPNYNQLNKASIRVWYKRDEEADCCQPKTLPVKSEGPTGRTASNSPRRIWPDRLSTTLLTKTEVSSGGELGVENVEGGETYIGAGRLHLRDTRRLLHGRPTGSYNTYRPSDGPGSTLWRYGHEESCIRQGADNLDYPRGEGENEADRGSLTL